MSSIIRNFHPVWFVSIMGTGISSSILYNYNHQWCQILGIIMFTINSILLLSTTIIFLLGILLYNTLSTHIYSQNNVFLGCYAMGFTSWCNMLHLLTQSQPILAYVLWWVGICLSLFTSYYIFFLNIKTQINNISFTLLLPVVTLTVVSSSGGIILKTLPQNLQHSTLVISYLLWGNSMFLSFIITTIIINSYIKSTIPPIQSIFTMFIPIGFLGQGSYAIQLFGANYHLLNNNIIGELVEEITLWVGLFLIISGIFMTFIAISSVISTMVSGDSWFIRFHKGWWAMTFPLGTMSLSTNQVWVLKHSWTVFRVIGIIYAVSLIVIVVVCLIGCVLFERPVQTQQDDEEKTLNCHSI